MCPSLELYKRTWEGPVPEVAITSVDRIASSAIASPFLIAITAE